MLTGQHPEASSLISHELGRVEPSRRKLVRQGHLLSKMIRLNTYH